MLYDQYVFKQSAEENVYVRKCYGFETITSNMQQACDGLTHLTISAAARFAPAPSRDTLKSQVHDAWITLRHQIPALACQNFRFPAPDNHFAFRYTVPRSSVDAYAWAKDTVVFHHHHPQSLYQKHCELRDKRWWPCLGGHHVAELHVSPSPIGWQFSMVVSHNSIDGRSSFVILDKFLSILADIVEGKAKSVSSLVWGGEIKRLPPAGVFTTAVALAELAEGGSLPSQLAEISSAPIAPAYIPKGKKDDVYTQEDEYKQDTQSIPGPPTLVPWMFPLVRTGHKGDVSRRLTFTRDLTSKLHAVAKAHGRTITQVVTALSVLAHSETTLKVAGGVSASRFHEVASTFSHSTHYLVAWNFINHRNKFLGGYDVYGKEKCAPLCSTNGVPLFLSMNSVRSMLTLDETHQSAGRTLDMDAFWNGLVKETADGWRATDTSLEGYAIREAAMQASLDAFNPHMLDVPSIVVSSIGDLGRLNLLSRFLPSPDHTKPLVVHDVVCGIRIRTPPVMNLLYQYDGRLSCHFYTASEFNTAETLKLMTDAFEEWTAALVQ